jgi:hypothetical protein
MATTKPPQAARERKEERMTRKLYLLLLAGALGLGSASSAMAAGPPSPGACHMMDASSQGVSGMFGSNGLGNMIDLVSSSLQSGCTP